MYHFDPYNVLLAIATNIPHAAYDWFCAPGSQLECSKEQNWFEIEIFGNVFTNKCHFLVTGILHYGQLYRKILK